MDRNRAVIPCVVRRRGDYRAGLCRSLRVSNAQSSIIRDRKTGYRGRIVSWNVVNEAIEARDGRADGLRRSVLVEAFNESYLDPAFRFLVTHASDPSETPVYTWRWSCHGRHLWQASRRECAMCRFMPSGCRLIWLNIE
jgi:hypothetical protein